MVLWVFDIVLHLGLLYTHIRHVFYDDDDDDDDDHKK